MTFWEIDTKIENLINKNIKTIPWEGDEVDKESLKICILDFIKELELSDLILIKER